MSDLDLSSPLELEAAEVVTAAVARAMTGVADLRYRRHLLHSGRRAVPVRAPHVHPEAALQTMDDLRGSGDGVALRVLHSNPEIYRRHLPEDAFEELIYEMLEQFRVEALAPLAQRGTRSNLHHRFANWSEEYVNEGLLENDLGLLLFTVVHVCRSRVLAEPIDDEVNDRTESTRFGIYQVLGRHLLDLRPNITDQDCYAQHAAAIASAIGELASSAPSTSSTGRLSSAILAMLQFEADSDLDDVAMAPVSAGLTRARDTDSYTPFTTEFDRTVPVSELVLPHNQRVTRQELDTILAEHRPVGAYLNRSVLALFPAPIDTGWLFEQEEGRLDPRLLSRLATSPGEARVFRSEIDVAGPEAAVTVLIDCSGSMKANIPQVAALVDLLTRALDRVDVVTEVLGFTTGAWNGGRTHKEWLAQGRPAHPGRLNEVCQIVFKDASTSWRQSRGALSSLLWTPIFREGIDGEALQWAYDRLRSIDVAHRYLILVSDGSPMDGATSLTNGEHYLDRHLADVAAGIEESGDVHLLGLGLGHDMSTYFRRSHMIDPERILTLPVARSVVDFLADR